MSLIGDETREAYTQPSYSLFRMNPAGNGLETNFSSLTTSESNQSGGISVAKRTQMNSENGRSLGAPQMEITTLAGQVDMLINGHVHQNNSSSFGNIIRSSPPPFAPNTATLAGDALSAIKQDGAIEHDDAHELARAEEAAILGRRQDSFVRAPQLPPSISDRVAGMAIGERNNTAAPAPTTQSLPIRSESMELNLERMHERVSTLEGRQRLIQSKLAQIVDAMGVGSAGWEKRRRRLAELLEKDPVVLGTGLMYDDDTEHSLANHRTGSSFASPAPMAAAMGIPSSSAPPPPPQRGALGQGKQRRTGRGRRHGRQSSSHVSSELSPSPPPLGFGGFAAQMEPPPQDYNLVLMNQRLDWLQYQMSNSLEFVMERVNVLQHTLDTFLAS